MTNAKKKKILRKYPQKIFVDIIEFLMMHLEFTFFDMIVVSTQVENFVIIIRNTNFDM